MSDGSKIEWTDHTFNPWWGCAHVSPGCVNCYAETFSKRTGHDAWGAHGTRRLFGDKHWSQPEKWNLAAERSGVPAKVFCASMADVFEDHPALVEPRKRLWDLIERTPWLRWQLLTKRPENVTGMAPWGRSWPDHVWLGISVEDQQRADERIPILAQIPAAELFLSCEPLLGPVNLRRWLFDGGGQRVDYGSGVEYDEWADPMVDWVIVGGESGPKARPMLPVWASSLRDQCQAAGVAYFFKQWGEWAPLVPGVAPGRQIRAYPGALIQRVGKKRAGRELDGRTWDEYPVAAS